RFKELIAQRTFEKPPCKAVFSFTEQKITRREKGSQEEHLLEDGLGVMIAIFKCCTTHQANKVFLLTIRHKNTLHENK
ncbi:hypothetical protein DQC24_24780, partial [Salmonella enterica subsp. enterica serovar Typhimurium]|nr:hypothetical protein [Salmonella enterica subsp. enterica serovar Typhimurium]